MEVLLWVLGICFAIGLLVAAIPAIFMTGLVLYSFWPSIAGLVLGVWIWVAGHDNIGMLVILAAIGANVFWVRSMDHGGGGGQDPMAGKIKIYDKSGNVTGYHDKS